MRDYYYRYLYHNLQIKLCWFLPMIRAAERRGGAIGTKEPVRINGEHNTLFISPEMRAADGRLTLTLKWEDEGEQHRQAIPILRRESNLIKDSYVYYFLCPFGYKAKKLFYIQGSFRSRRAFPHRYRQQDLSRERRGISKCSMEEPYRKYGKEYYRGRLTPYGKRCKRYEETIERGEAAFLSLAKKMFNLNK